MSGETIEYLIGLLSCTKGQFAFTMDNLVTNIQNRVSFFLLKRDNSLKVKNKVSCYLLFVNNIIFISQTIKQVNDKVTLQREASVQN